MSQAPDYRVPKRSLYSRQVGPCRVSLSEGLQRALVTGHALPRDEIVHQA